MMTPGYRLLPEPSILEKLGASKPDAPESIMRIFESVAQTRRDDTAASNRSRGFLRTLSGTCKRAFTDSFFYFFHPRRYLKDAFIEPRNPWDSASAAINRDWAVTGDDLRTAILSYMDQNKITPPQIDLTAKEIVSLSFVDKSRVFTPQPRP